MDTTLFFFCRILTAWMRMIGLREFLSPLVGVGTEKTSLGQRETKETRRKERSEWKWQLSAEPESMIRQS